MKDIEKCCYCGHPVTVEGFYDAESGEEWEKVTPIETENEELKQRVKKLEARIEELISSKGIKELEAVAEAAKELHEWIIDKALICPDKRLAAALKEAGYLK